jgi:hypothetical protein
MRIKNVGNERRLKYDRDLQTDSFVNFARIPHTKRFSQQVGISTFLPLYSLILTLSFSTLIHTQNLRQLQSKHLLSYIVNSLSKYHGNFLPIIFNKILKLNTSNNDEGIT